MNKKKIKKMLKNKRFVIVMILVVIGLICLILLKNMLSPNGNISKYGNRLDNIKKYPVSSSLKKDITSSLDKNDKITSSKINVHGRIINVIYNVKEGTSVDDSHAIAKDILSKFSDKIKGYYDIEFIVTMTDEKGTTQTVQDNDGNKKDKTVTVYPIMGYKNSSSDEITW